MITLIAILIFIIAAIALILAGAIIVGWLLFVIGLILAAINYIKATKLVPTEKRCPYCNQENLTFTKNTAKKGAPTVAICQSCGSQFDYWTAVDIAKEKKHHLIRMIIFGVLTLVTTIMMLGSGKSSSDEPVQQSSGSETSTETDTDESDSETAKTETKDEASYEITNYLFESYVNTLGSPSFNAIVEITNTGSKTLYLNAKSFDIENSEGSLVTTESMISSCPDLIKPGEIGYLYTSLGGSYPDGTDVNQELTLVPNLSIKTATAEPVDYEVSDTSISPGTFGGPQILGRVTNTSDQDDKSLYIQAILYDSEGNVLAISGTNLTDFTAGSQQSFEITFFSSNLDYSKVANYKVIARKSHMQF